MALMQAPDALNCHCPSKRRYYAWPYLNVRTLPDLKKSPRSSIQDHGQDGKGSTGKRKDEGSKDRTGAET